MVFGKIEADFFIPDNLSTLIDANPPNHYQFMLLNEKAIFRDYDILLPSKLDGGYLVISLYEKIQAGEINELFTVNDIRNCLQEISDTYGLAAKQTDRVLKLLSHYFLRIQPDQPGKYYLSDYAKNVVELMKNKLENPYKNFPLKLSFERAFTLKLGDIHSIHDLEGKFGRIFIEGPKKVISDHLDGLEDELRNAYHELNTILEFHEQNATNLVKQFAKVFQQFGMRADDITTSMDTKDKFLKELEAVVDQFYNKLGPFGSSVAESDQLELQVSWERAKEIQLDIRTFFKSVDQKINFIRRQIFDASEKLSELHEHFTDRAQMRIQVKRLYANILKQASYHDDGARFTEAFPLKMVVSEFPRMLYPEQYDFIPPPPNRVIRISRDTVYEQQERERIEKDQKRQEVIREWVNHIKNILAEKGILSLKEAMDMVSKTNEDISMAYEVATLLVAFTASDREHRLEILLQTETVSNNEMKLWKTNLRSFLPTIF